MRRFAKASGAIAERVRTFQIGTSLRALELFPQVARRVDGRPAGRLGRALLPEFPQAPVRLPDSWLPA